MLKELQRLRGIACIMVLLQHVCLVAPIAFFQNTVPSVFQYGSCGVYLFFVISGFVIAFTQKNKLENCCKSDDFVERLYSSGNVLKSFYVRRAFRLIPALLGVLLIIISFHSIFTNDRVAILGAIKTLFDIISCNYADCVNTNVLYEAFHLQGTGPLWTLSIEVFFYLTFPVVFLLLKNNTSRVKFFLISGAISWFCFRWIFDHVLHLSVLNYYNIFINLDGLLLGTFLGITYDRKKADTAENHWIWSCLSLILIFGMWCPQNFSAVQDEVRWCNTAVFFSVWLVYLAVYNKGVLNIPIIKNMLEYLGDRSYSFYIYQMFLSFFINWLSNSNYLSIKTNSLECGWLYIITLLLLTEVSYNVIEKPMRKFGDSLSKKYNID